MALQSIYNGQVVNEPPKPNWKDSSDHPANLERKVYFDDEPTANKTQEPPPITPLNQKAMREQTMGRWESIVNEASSFFRQSLMPRGPGSHSGLLVDSKKDIDFECDYPRWITPWMYRYMYEREGLAKRANDLLTDECFSIPISIYETEDEKDITPWETEFKAFDERVHLLHYIKRADKATGLGYFGILFYGWDDSNSADFQQPVSGVDPDTGKIDDNMTPVNLQYLRVFDESQVRIARWNTDKSSPRCGHPELYWIRFFSVNTPAPGQSVQGQQDALVHWTRVEHFAEGGEFLGVPRLQCIYNRLYDLRKILSSSGEMYWKGGFPGLSFEINPEIAQQNAEPLDENAIREEFQRYSSGLQRYLAVKGLTVKSLAPQVSSPKDHYDIMVKAICSSLGYPLRVFQGTEQEQRTSSTQDETKSWNRDVSARQWDYVIPMMVRRTIDRCISYKALGKPAKGTYVASWKDRDTVNDSDKAELSFKQTQAIAQYINGFAWKIMKPTHFFTIILRLSPEEAAMIVDSFGGDDHMIKSIADMVTMDANGQPQFNKFANSLDGGVQQKGSATVADKLGPAKK